MGYASGSNVRSCGLALVFAMICGFGVSEAAAAVQRGPTAWIPLERDPLLLHHALPPELQCEFDEDGDGIDDEMERKIAQAVVPEFRFDSGENARRPDEPHVIWNASVIPMRQVDIPLEREAILIRFRFGMLWEEDGGFALDDSATALDGSSLWVANGSSLELWQQDSSASARLLSRASLGESITALAARSGITLAGSRKGLTPAIANDAGLRLGAVVPLCGTPVQMAPMSDNLWVVRTTLGLAFVDMSEPSKARLASHWSLSPLGGGALAPVQSDALSLAACRLLDLVATPIFALGLGSPAIAPLGPERLAVAHGLALWDLDIPNAEWPRLQGALSTNAYLDALWADEPRGRVYGIGRRGFSSYKPIIDMRSTTPTLMGEHDIAQRILRSDEGRLSSRIRSDGRPEIAEVAR